MPRFLEGLTESSPILHFSPTTRLSQMPPVPDLAGWPLVGTGLYSRAAPTRRRTDASSKTTLGVGLHLRAGASRVGGYTLAAGVQNLFDIFPDRNTTVNSFNGIQTFPSQSPFGMNGRTLYGRIGWTF
jgi:outer membrane receptor protein involved in Fe transport